MRVKNRIVSCSTDRNLCCMHPSNSVFSWITQVFQNFYSAQFVNSSWCLVLHDRSSYLPPWLHKKSLLTLFPVYKRLAYMTISTSAATVSIDHFKVPYLGTILINLQPETPKGTSGRTRFSTWGFNEHVWADEISTAKAEAAWGKHSESLLEATLKPVATLAQILCCEGCGITVIQLASCCVLSLQKSAWGNSSLSKELMIQVNWMCKRYHSDT